MHLSRAECTSRRSQDRPTPHHPGQLPSTPFCADPGPRITTPGEKGSMSLSHRGSCWSVMMWAAGRGREDTRRPPFQVAGSRRPLVRPRPRRDERGQWCGRGEWGGGPMHSDDRGPVRARVCYAPFPLLRLLTLHCTRKRGAAEGEGAQQTERGVADAKVRRGRPSAIPRGPRATRRGLRNASPAQRNPPHLAPCEPSVTESA